MQTDHIWYPRHQHPPRAVGFDSNGDELWSVEAAQSLNPDDDSGQWLWSDETSMEQQWFDTMEAAVDHAENHQYT